MIDREMDSWEKKATHYCRCGEDSYVFGSVGGNFGDGSVEEDVNPHRHACDEDEDFEL